MSSLQMGHFKVADAGEGNVNVGKAVVGAIGGALAMGLLYGVAGRFIGEYSYAFGISEAHLE